MKTFVALFFVIFNVILVTSFTHDKRVDDYMNKNLFVTPDGEWSAECPVPECEKIEKAVKYPTPQARYFYQCISDGKRWIPQLIPCPCDLLFSYKDQQCVYPWLLQQWCSPDYVVDILPIRCE